MNTDDQLKKQIHWYKETKKGDLISIYNEKTKKWEWMKADDFFP